MAQVLLGRSYSDLCYCMGEPPHTERGDQLKQWSFYREDLVEKYQPPVYINRCEDQHYTTQHPHGHEEHVHKHIHETEYIPGYHYYTTEPHSLNVTATLRHDQVQDITYHAYDWSLAVNSSWRVANQAELAWNAAAANDDLETVLKMEVQYPALATHDNRVRCCLQAARYGSAKVLAHYLTSGQVKPEDSGATWMSRSGESSDEFGSFALTHKTLKDLIAAKPKLAEKLRKLNVGL